VSDELHRLDLRFDLDTSFDPDAVVLPDYPLVTILIDGRDVLAQGHSFIGFDPEVILGHDSPLLPSDQPRRVAVYRCTCGEPGCGVVAPRISEINGWIAWTDFRDYTGVFVGPTVAEWAAEEELNAGTRLPLPEMYFDRKQYRAEVARATADRSWETERRRTARLLREYLLREAGTLERTGYELTWVAVRPELAAYHLSFWKGDAQIVVELHADAGDPEEQASAMAEQLLRTSPEAWPVVFRGGSIVAT
jgi:hypothetical protein